MSGMDLIQAPTLRGDTVTLRPLSVADAAALAAAAAESRESYQFTRVPNGIAEAGRYIELALADRERDAPDSLDFDRAPPQDARARAVSPPQLDRLDDRHRPRLAARASLLHCAALGGVAQR